MRLLQCLPEPILKQSPNDNKQYKTLTLANGLRVLLVHNEQTNKSAAALAVNIGHFSDPSNREGLAHFLEHMLFLGTKSYPDGSEYQKYISQHGGSNNAWTATEHTCFFFDIQHQHFTFALDRFSQFFISPLLSQEFVEKERQNVDAEFKLKLKDDIRRLYDVHKETINQAHPFSKFSVGSIDTLADRKESDLTTEIRDFFQQHYRANIMTLVLEGPQSLDELSQLAKNKFTDIKAATSSPKIIDTPLYLPEHQQIKINVKPVKNDRQLIVSFAMPSIDPYYRNKPESILTYLLGHEGKGSILSYLKKQRWALSLTAGSGVNGSNFKDFNLSISLTELGEQHINEIISSI
ncbi:MAG: insulysin, partial [Colwellia sp.]